MHPLLCPICKQQGLTLRAKLWLGPLRSAPCMSCGRKLSVSWLPYVGAALVCNLLPFAGIWVASVLSRTYQLGPIALAIIAGAVCVSLSAFSFWLHYRLVPMVARQ